MMRNYHITVADEGTWNDQEFDRDAIVEGYLVFSNSETGRVLAVRADQVLWFEYSEILPTCPDHSSDVPE